MTATLEKPAAQPQPEERRAIEVIDAARHDIGEPLDHFDVRPLTEEFTFLARRLGQKSLWDADAASNFSGTFKVRGAYNKLHQLAEEGIKNVTVASAGNHLAGVALAGNLLGIKVTAAVPLRAPESKLDNARMLYPDTNRFTIKRVGQTVDDSMRWARAKPGVFVHPFDDSAVVEGQGTVAYDILRSFSETDMSLHGVIVPIGGGGLLTGVAKELQALSPQTIVYGVEVEGSDSLSRSRKTGQLTTIEHPNEHFSGLAVKQTGALAFQAVQRFSNIRLVSVAEQEVETVANEYLEERIQRHLDHIPYEPTSLVAFAGLTHIVKEQKGKNLVVIGTGRNESVESMWN